MAIKIMPYKTGSKGARMLAEACGVRRLKVEGSKWVPKTEQDIVVNWGKCEPFDYPCAVLNRAESVAQAACKRTSLTLMEEAGVRVPPFTTSADEAAQWDKVMCRTMLRANSGRGIVVWTQGDGAIPRAPLYTQYIKSKSEWRIHVWEGEVLDVQRKVKEAEREEVNWDIRSRENGFIFQRHGLDCPEAVKDQALRAVEALSLDFGAVDVLHNEHYQRAYVLEVNTAPGLEGTTLDNYATKIRGLPNIKAKKPVYTSTINEREN